LGFATRPDETGECFFEPLDINFGTNDLARQFAMALGSALAAQPTVKHGVYGAFRVPKNYVGTAKLAIASAATVTTGNIVFDFDYRAIASTETADPATWQESVTATQAVAGTARNLTETLITLTSGNFAVDDLVEFFFGRDGVDAADTMAGRCYVMGLSFEYADS